MTCAISQYQRLLNTGVESVADSSPGDYLQGTAKHAIWQSNIHVSLWPETNSFWEQNWSKNKGWLEGISFPLLLLCC